MAVKKKRKLSQATKKRNQMYIGSYGAFPINKEKKSRRTPYKVGLSLFSNIIIVSLIIIIFYGFDFALEEKSVKSPPSVTLPLSDDNCYSDYSHLINKDFVASLLRDKLTDIHLSPLEFEEPLLHAEVIDNTNNPALFTDEQILPEVAPIVVIVIDDMGFDGYKTDDIIALPPPLDLSFIPYVGKLHDKINRALEAGHEIMVHFPMEPLNSKIDSGPGTLKSGMSSDDIHALTTQTLDKFNYFAGVNNHMGSKFTADKEGMREFLRELKKYNVFFLDSKTTPKSQVAELAQEFAIPFLERDVFLDNTISEEAILKQLSQVEAIALKRGYAIGIGHPYKATASALKTWIPQIKDKGFKILPLGELMKYLANNPSIQPQP